MILIKGGYIVKKHDLTPKQIRCLQTELTVCPDLFNNNSPFARAQQTFKVYRESESRFRIPRFYGFKVFGPPLCSKIKPGISIDLQFEGTLKSALEQPHACSLVIEQLKTVGGGILSLPTGYGKTTCALYIIAQMKVKTLIIVHKEFLMNQWLERIAQFLPSASVGIIRQNKVDSVGKDIVIAMLQSLSLKDYPEGTFDDFGFTVIDETHHVCSKVFSRALFNVGCRYMLGLSATPERKDGLTKVLHWFLGPMAFQIKRKNQEGVTVEVLKYNCETYSEPPPVSVAGQVSIPAVISLICSIQERNEIIINKICALLKIGRKIIILSERRSHCEMLLENVSSNLPSISCGLYMGGMKQSQLKENEACDAIFATYSLAHEGLDIPTLNTLVMATPKTDVVQSCGRILREAGVRQFDPLIVDIVDSFATLPGQFRKRKAFYKQSGFILDNCAPTEDESADTSTPGCYSFISA